MVVQEGKAVSDERGTPVRLLGRCRGVERMGGGHAVESEGGALKLCVRDEE